MRVLILAVLMLGSFYVNAESEKLFVGFGEIPVLADSFKPSVGYGKRSGDFEYGIYLQLEDDLQRDEESFNADFGQDGLDTSTEETGVRAMLQGRYYPFENPFYLSFGLLFSGGDTELMEFDTRNRVIGQNSYDTSISVDLESDEIFAPALGIGMAYPISGGWYFTADFTMAWFNSVPTPDVEISTSMTVSASDLRQLENDILDNYDSNFHNRYHLFNIGLAYEF
ncbi:MAG: hypothetical protein GY806_14275 [Gammaproteobacteria bacterium]|nr:hypothetical protein [Gammaproteobacteria bacterium]